MTLDVEKVRDYAVPLACLCVVICSAIITNLIASGISDFANLRTAVIQNTMAIKSADIPQIRKDIGLMQSDIKVLKDRSDGGRFRTQGSSTPNYNVPIPKTMAWENNN